MSSGDETCSRCRQWDPGIGPYGLCRRCREGEYPYAGTSGYSGTDTSAERAAERDASGETARLQTAVIALLDAAGTEGMTVTEMKKVPGYDHHGSTSGALSVLHKEERISRLLARRGNCRIYVANQHVNGRSTDSQGRNTPVHIDPLRPVVERWLAFGDDGWSRAGRHPRDFIEALRAVL